MAYFRERAGNWSFTVDIGRDPVTLKRRQVTRGGFKDERTARKACDKLISDVEKGKRLDKVTLEQFAKMYFESKVKPVVTESTYINQWQWARDYIFPKLGKKPIDKITNEQIQNFYTELLSEGVSRGLIKNVAMVIAKIFKWANIWNYTVKNEAKHATPPTYKPAKMKVWTQVEAKSFLERSKGFRQYILYSLALSTGMRLGEMLALTWKDVDLDNARLSVTKSLKYSPTKGLHVKTTKTANSQRNIDIPDSTVKDLRDHFARQLPGTVMVVDYIAEYVLPSEASRRFVNDSKAAKMPPIRFHDLRHTHATMLLDRGFNAKVVAERLGDTVETVMRTYAHVLPSMQKEVAAAIQEML